MCARSCIHTINAGVDETNNSARCRPSVYVFANRPVPHCTVTMSWKRQMQRGGVRRKSKSGKWKLRTWTSKEEGWDLIKAAFTTAIEWKEGWKKKVEKEIMICKVYQLRLKQEGCDWKKKITGQCVVIPDLFIMFSVQNKKKKVSAQHPSSHSNDLLALGHGCWGQGVSS